MKKIIFIIKELFYLIKHHKLAFLAPIFILLLLLTFLTYYFGPTAITAFIYAGI